MTDETRRDEGPCRPGRPVVGLQRGRGPRNDRSKSHGTIEHVADRLERGRLELFDVTGRLVRTEIDRSMAAGRYEHELRGGVLPSGVYFYRIRMGGYERARSMVLVK